MKFVLKLVGLVAGVILVVAYGAGYAKSHESVAESAHSYTADRLIEDYDFLVRNNGRWVDRCVRAGAIVQAYISAHEDDNFQQWTKIKQRDCARAGL